MTDKDKQKESNTSTKVDVTQAKPDTWTEAADKAQDDLDANKAVKEENANEMESHSAA